MYLWRRICSITTVDFPRKLSIFEGMIAKSLLATRANMMAFEGHIPYALVNNFLRRYLNFCEGILPSLVDSFLVNFELCLCIFNLGLYLLLVISLICIKNYFLIFLIYIMNYNYGYFYSIFLIRKEDIMILMLILWSDP